MVTRSPGKILIKCIRIFPEMWAKTRCPLSSFTLNMAFGKVSTTVPSTSIASSLGIVPKIGRSPDRPELKSGSHSR
jgi:hypothetical protein